MRNVLNQNIEDFVAPTLRPEEKSVHMCASSKADTACAPLSRLQYLVHVDGACRGNPGPGGWGAVLQLLDGTRIVKERELRRGERLTTNNRMELMAAIAALEALEDNGRPATVVTDSTYVVDGITSWVEGWLRNGWRRADGKPVSNIDLWQRLIEAEARREVTWTHVNGHAGHEGNERADRLATAARDEAAKGRRRHA